MENNKLSGSMTHGFLNAKIKKTGLYLPKQVLTSEGLAEELYGDSGLSPEEILQKAKRISKQTGIFERRVASEGEAASHLATEAIKTMRDELYPDILMVATTSGDCPTPATASFIHQQLDLPPFVHGFDVVSSCTSSLSAMRSACGLASTGQKVWVVSTECKAKVLNKEDEKSRSLFADGAVASEIVKSEGNEWFFFPHVELNSEFATWISTEVGGSREPLTIENIERSKLRIKNGRRLYHETLKGFERAILRAWSIRGEVLLEHGVSPEQARGGVFLHQANANILWDLKDRLPDEISMRFPVLMSDVGNLVCASLPMARARTLKYAEHKGEMTLGESTFGQAYLSGLSLKEKNSLQTYLFKQERGRGLPQVDVWVSAGGGFQVVAALHGTGF